MVATAASPEAERERRERRAGFALVAPAALWTLAFFVLPVLATVALSFFTKEGGRLSDTPSLANYARLVEQGYFLASVWNSLLVTAAVTVLSIALAYPLAAAIAFGVPARLQRLCLVLAVLPFWTSYVVRSYAWLLVLAPNGIVNQALLGLGLVGAPVRLSYNMGATVLGFVHFFTMLATLTIYASLVRIDTKLILAARDLGAGGWTVFRRVVWPLSLPGVFAGAFLTIVLTVGDYVTPQILGGNNDLVLPQAILMQIQRRADIPMAAALSVVMTLIVGLAYILMARRLTAGRA
jgi:spermidine/putrescine transport system permease protein